MKSIFDQATSDELISRVNTLTNASTAQWGKMNVYQMVKHCNLWEEMILGKPVYKQAFIGKLFGKLAMKNLLKDEKPMGRNSPTVPQMIITENGDVEAEKAKWVTFINGHTNFSNPSFVHPFFGKMTKEQIGHLAYKHADHHLRQFNV